MSAQRLLTLTDRQPQRSAMHAALHVRHSRTEVESESEELQVLVFRVSVEMNMLQSEYFATSASERKKHESYMLLRQEKRVVLERVVDVCGLKCYSGAEYVVCQHWAKL